MSEALIKTPAVFGENGNFILERELGSGGMGGVYMGRDKMLDRAVAVKVMLKEFGSDPEFMERFKREAQAAARLIHPNIAQIYSYGVADGMPYIAMELASGGSLHQLMTSNPGTTDITRVLKICQQIAQALQCATDMGCVHGDVKPENVLLDANGNAKLVDFGLAGMQKNTDEIWGTPYYISPEKVKKEVIDFRADMYSLGATLYHALCGVAPFEGSDPVLVVKKRFEGAPKKPSEIRPEITPAIDNLVMRMLALEKNDRFPSFEALTSEFRAVLATGLTQKLPAEAAAASAANGAGARKNPADKPKPGTVRGGRRMVLRPRPGAMKKLADDDGDTGRKHASKEDGEDEEESGGMGAKVLLFILGGIALIGGVIGFLVWYQIHDKEVREAEAHSQVVANISKARAAIADTKIATENYEREFRAFAANATVECEKFTQELKALIPDYANELQPGPTEELLKAIQLTNVVVAATNELNAASTNAVGSATNAVASAEESAARPGKPAKANSGKAKRLSLEEEAEKYGLKLPEEMDPASPDYMDFMVQLKEAREKAEKGGATANAESAGDTAANTNQVSATEVAKPVEKKPPPAVINDMRELWERTYSCQASVIKLTIQTRKVIAECQKADEIKGETREAMNALSELSQSVKDLYDQTTNSKDVENVKKGIGYIKSKGKKAVEQTVKRLKIEKLEAERKAKKEAEAQAEKERLEKLEAERLAKIEREAGEIKELFNKIAGQGCFRQLDWDSAYRQLEQYASNTVGGLSVESVIALRFERKKVDMMRSVQDIFIAKMKDHVFKGKLKGCKVLEANKKDILILKPDGKTKQRIMWQKFYKEYPGNFNEIINYYIVYGRKNKVIPNLKAWSNAMIGAALTMKLVCSEVNGATEKCALLAKEVYQKYPDYEKTVREIFPEINFDEVAKEE